MTGLAKFMYPNAVVEPLPNMNAFRISHVVTYEEVSRARENPGSLVDKIEGKRWKRRRLHWGKKR
jgi:hypothetical protein